MKKLTKKEWQKMAATNCLDSYSMAVQFAILNLFEAGCKTEKECDEVLRELRLGLSGQQALFAIGFVLEYKQPSWLSKDMVRLSKKSLQKEQKNPCSNPTPHAPGSLPCCAGLVQKEQE